MLLICSGRELAGIGVVVVCMTMELMMGGLRFEVAGSAGGMVVSSNGARGSVEIGRW